MADEDVALLRHNWEKITKVKKGSKLVCYKNKKTGQEFYSEEDFERYMNYVYVIRPRLRGVVFTRKLLVDICGTNMVFVARINNAEAKQKEHQTENAGSKSISIAEAKQPQERGGEKAGGSKSVSVDGAKLGKLKKGGSG